MMDNVERALIKLIKKSKGNLTLCLVRREEILAGALVLPGGPAAWDAWLEEWAKEPSECLACDVSPENPAAFAVVMPRHGTSPSVVTAVCSECAKRSDEDLIQLHVAMVQQAYQDLRRSK